MKALRKETERVILPGEASLLTKHIQERQKQGIRLNFNHLGEADLKRSGSQKKLHILKIDMELFFRFRFA